MQHWDTDKTPQTAQNKLTAASNYQLLITTHLSYDKKLSYYLQPSSFAVFPNISMTGEQRAQPWKAFWQPVGLPEKAGDASPEIVFERGKTVIISDSGGFTPKTYTQLYKADAAPNTTHVNGDVSIEKYAPICLCIINVANN
jgi:hypothetical protein